MKPSIFILSTWVLFFGCKGNDVLTSEPDPLWESFWNKKVISVMEMRCKDSTCMEYYEMARVFGFDQKGNVILRTSLFNGDSTNEYYRTAYDDHRLPTKSLQITFDTRDMDFFTYEFDQHKGLMYQYCYPGDSTDWASQPPIEIDSAKIFVVEYVLDGNSRILKKIDTLYKAVTEFSYRDNLLVKKERTFRTEIRETWNYYYNEDRLTKAVRIVPPAIITYFFSNNGELISSKEETPGLNATYFKYNLVRSDVKKPN